ncbi:guanine nucleotide binding protein, alpha subunit [Globomyces pollinis-pini]|nr:guanine nucleotide binding protein, alpha subunit [Globomyces pollinis-pini]
MKSSKRSPSGSTSPQSTSIKRENSKILNEYLKEEKLNFERLKKEPKLLLLGSSDSGKSTFLKQLKILHGNGFSEEEFKSAKQCALGNIGYLMETLLPKCQGIVELEKYSSDILQYLADDPGPFDAFPLIILKAINMTWNNPDFKAKFSEFENDYPPTLPHFLEKINAFGSPSYVVTNDDVLLSRYVTQTISESIFQINELRLHIYDVSGLKYHRKQWLPYFDDVLSIVFIVSSSSYDQLLIEDGKTNRMQDALDLFEFILNHPLLEKPDMILFFNKKDLFEKKVKKAPIKKYFPDYKGILNYFNTLLGRDGSVSEGLEFFQQLFLSKKHEKLGKKFIRVHHTCCTDSQAMNSIIQTVILSINKNAIYDLGVI